MITRSWNPCLLKVGKRRQLVWSYRDESAIELIECNSNWINLQTLSKMLQTNVFFRSLNQFIAVQLVWPSTHIHTRTNEPTHSSAKLQYSFLTYIYSLSLLLLFAPFFPFQSVINRTINSIRFRLAFDLISIDCLRRNHS